VVCVVSVFSVAVVATLNASVLGFLRASVAVVVTQNASVLATPISHTTTQHNRMVHGIKGF